MPSTYYTALISNSKVTKEKADALGTSSLPQIKGHQIYPNMTKQLKKLSTLGMINTKFRRVITGWTGETVRGTQKTSMVVTMII